MIFLFSIIKISGDELVKSEQSILHPGKELAVLFVAGCRRVMPGGGVKKFFLVLLFTLFTLHFFTLFSLC